MEVTHILMQRTRVLEEPVALVGGIAIRGLKLHPRGLRRDQPLLRVVLPLEQRRALGRDPLAGRDEFAPGLPDPRGVVHFRTIEDLLEVLLRRGQGDRQHAGKKECKRPHDQRAGSSSRAGTMMNSGSAWSRAIASRAFTCGTPSGNGSQAQELWAVTVPSQALPAVRSKA